MSTIVHGIQALDDDANPDPRKRKLAAKASEKENKSTKAKQNKKSSSTSSSSGAGIIKKTHLKVTTIEKEKNPRAEIYEQVDQGDGTKLAYVMSLTHRSHGSEYVHVARQIIDMIRSGTYTLDQAKALKPHPSPESRAGQGWAALVGNLECSELAMGVTSHLDQRVGSQFHQLLRAIRHLRWLGPGICQLLSIRFFKLWCHRRSRAIGRLDRHHRRSRADLHRRHSVMAKDRPTIQWPAGLLMTSRGRQQTCQPPKQSQT